MTPCIHKRENTYAELGTYSPDYEPCAPHPGPGYDIAPNWRDDPLNPAVAFVAKTQSEMDAEADAETHDLWKDQPQNDKLILALYSLDQRVRVLEGKPAIDKPTFWNGLLNYLRNKVFFDF